MKKWTLMIGIVIGAMVFALAAFAAAPLSALAQAAATATGQAAVATTQPGTRGPGGGLHGPRDGGGNTLISAAASVTGLTNQEVVTQLQAGKSLAQIAQDNGKTAEDVIQAARTQLVALLAQKVTDGRLTQAQSDARLAEFDTNAATLVNSTTFGTERGFGPGFGGGRHGGPGGDTLISAAASVTGLTTQEVVTQLQAGKSLAQIAQDNGKTADDVIQAARTALVTRLGQEVTDGRLTQAQSDAKLAEFDANAATLVNSTTLGTERGFGPGFGGGRHGGPGGDTLIAAAASVTGLTTQEVVTQLQAGKSLAQIAQDNGKTAEDVIQAARTQLVALLAQKVTDGRLTQAQSDARLAEFDTNAATLVNSTTLGTERGFGPGFGGGRHGHGGPGLDDTATPAPAGQTF